MYCNCGCGQVTTIVEKTRSDIGLKKGDYYRFIKGHSSRTVKRTSKGKVCSKCRVFKLWSEFSTNKSQLDGFHNECLECSRNRSRKRLLENPLYNILKVNKITKEQYLNILNQQEYRCAICNKELLKPQVDHCHKTGKIRGILCQSCNTGIGKLGDTAEGVYKAYEYLQKC